MPKPRELEAHEVVTQYGSDETDPPFRRRPRFPSEAAVSDIIGRLDVSAACIQVRGRDLVRMRDAVRYSTVGSLRQAGFQVDHTPSKRIPGHVSVKWDGVWAEPVDLASGARPWLPSADARVDELFAYYDGPLLGIIRQHGVPHLSRCLVGQRGGSQVWLYATLTEGETAELKRLEGADFDARIAELSAADVVVALSNDEDGLVYWHAMSLLDVADERLPVVATQSLVEQLLRASEESQHLHHDLMASGPS